MTDLEKIQDALDFANEKHRMFFRKHSGVPYLIHPLKVLEKLTSWGITYQKYLDLWIASILHDVVEDSDATIEQIRIRFGDNIANLVDALTFKPEFEDKETYLQNFMQALIGALLIKIADRICNVLDYNDTQPGYAFKYLLKAEILIEIWWSRKEEIIEVFGEEIHLRVATEWISLKHGGLKEYR